jgi:diguanylate cyclase (GGDEF)-like protein/PAS domain S-box-containing protein
VAAVVERDGTVRYISQNVPDVFGFTPDELVGTNMLDHMDLEWSAFAIESIGFSLENPGQHLPMLFRFLTKDGGGIVCEVTANNQFDDPAVEGLVVYVRRWEERVLLDRVLDSLAGGAPLEETLGLLVQVMAAEMLESVGAILHDPVPEGFAGIVAAPGLDPLLGGDGAALPIAEQDRTPWARAVASGLPGVTPVEDLPPALAERARAAGFGCCWTWPVGVTDGIGVQACLVMWRRGPEEPEPSCELAAERLVRLTALALERTRSERRLVHAAHHDPLTGLANREQFFAALDAALGTPDDGPLVGVLYVDLDDFKPVNDVHGHGAGDQVLVEMAARLQAAVRPTDVVARLGGDEFAVLCAGVHSTAEVSAIADRLVEHVARPVDLGRGQVRIGASVGIALTPPGSCTSDVLVEAADHALYDVKAADKGGWCLAPTLDRTA